MAEKTQPQVGFIRHPVANADRQAAPSGNGITPVTTATAGEASIVTEIVTDAFETDPVWSWVFPERSTQRQYWRKFINGALRYPHTYRTGNYETVSVWIPPEKNAFLPEDSDNFEAIIQTLVGPRSDEVMNFLGKFDEFHPRDRPHYYLGLLAVQNNYRGCGIGMRLLRENLARFDAERMPA